MLFHLRFLLLTNRNIGSQLASRVLAITLLTIPRYVVYKQYTLRFSTNFIFRTERRLGLFSDSRSFFSVIETIGILPANLTTTHLRLSLNLRTIPAFALLVSRTLARNRSASKGRDSFGFLLLCGASDNARNKSKTIAATPTLTPASLPPLPARTRAAPEPQGGRRGSRKPLGAHHGKPASTRHRGSEKHLAHKGYQFIEAN